MIMLSQEIKDIKSILNEVDSEGRGCRYSILDVWRNLSEIGYISPASLIEKAIKRGLLIIEPYFIDDEAIILGEKENAELLAIVYLYLNDDYE